SPTAETLARPAAFPTPAATTALTPVTIATPADEARLAVAPARVAPPVPAPVDLPTAPMSRPLDACAVAEPVAEAVASATAVPVPVAVPTPAAVPVARHRAAPLAVRVAAHVRDAVAPRAALATTAAIAPLTAVTEAEPAENAPEALRATLALETVDTPPALPIACHSRSPAPAQPPAGPG